MIAESSRTALQARPVASVPNPSKSVENLDVLGAIWRYRWAVLLPTLLFAAIGFAFFQTRPTVFRSTAKLIVESDRPPLLDHQSGYVGGRGSRH